MSEESAARSAGLFDSLKGLAASLAAIAHTRLDLLSNDLEEERERLASMLTMMMAGLFCLGVGVLLLTMLVVVAFWDSHRLLVLAVMTGGFLAGGVVALGVVLQRFRSKPRIFAASLSEFAKDHRQLTSRS